MPSLSMPRGPLLRRLLPRLSGAIAPLLLAVPARAQIYSWHDEAGRLVLSDRRQGPVERTYAVPDTDAVRVTTPQTSRPDDYEALIAEEARRHGVRTDLVRAVVQVESGFNPYARSPKGALGLMQLMPATIEQLGVKNPFNPAENVRAGVAYLRQLLDRYGEDEQLALAAYNAGPGAVDRHGQTIPPYAETRQYVSRIKGLVGAQRPKTSAIYKTVEVIDGREVIKLTDRKPTGAFEIVGQ